MVTPNEFNKPKEDDPKVAAVQTSASVESVAQEATARQSIEGARVDEHPTVVNQGIGKDAQSCWQNGMASSAPISTSINATPR